MTQRTATPILAIPATVGAPEYEVRNARGTLLYTTSDEKLARAWLSARAAEWPGAQVDEITRWQTRRRVYKPVAYLRAVGS